MTDAEALMYQVKRIRAGYKSSTTRIILQI